MNRMYDSRCRTQNGLDLVESRAVGVTRKYEQTMHAVNYEAWRQHLLACNQTLGYKGTPVGPTRSGWTPERMRVGKNILNILSRDSC